ncbi:mediator of RNA polymerase II transcription subunit 17 [Dioscorea cayenensis subsp. rotundata]|uniref:Mediator of RNA polymerase II transcription subunit 17 n=1 Tax=Dioscorea cayennensis subsp. rotundata TaxID=55577 RepID=A0AB40B792_DIOCR|nr:mediator of RNA polymerase II transcription subunit 17 [Dioscorea cayenensis subsp. rotundata]
MKIDLDKLPLKRLDAIDESGNEQFPQETGHEEKRLDMIRRIDFSSIIDKKDTKKQKTSKDSSLAAPAAPAVWPWQGLVENLRLAHEELSIILDLINTVEANDAVAVAGMQRPKQLPNENVSDVAVSAATKLQRLRQVGRYFKQSSKALEQQVAREARFYGSLIRLQQNWKVKRHRLAVTGPGNEGFTIDLLESSLLDLTASARPSPLSTVRIDHDSAGILAVQLPQKSCRSLCLRFLGAHPNYIPRSFGKFPMRGSGEHFSCGGRKEGLTAEDVNECVKNAHGILREIHRSIFEEQVFDMVNHESYNSAPGVNVTGMREDFLQLRIGQEAYVCLCLIASGKEDSSQATDSSSQTQNGEDGILHSDSLDMMVLDAKHDTRNLLGFPSPVSLEIYLQDMFHRNVVTKVKDRRSFPPRHQLYSQHSGDGNGLLGHFCMTVSHRIFSNKVLSELECLVSRVPYLHLLSRPTWHSRTSSWLLSLKVPHSILHSGEQTKSLDSSDLKSRSQFFTKVVVNDDRISVSGEGSSSIIGSFRSKSADTCSVNCYSCDLEDLSMILLQQVAGQVIRWLHEEALVVGMKVSRDFLCLYFDLDQGETLGLVAHVDPHDVSGCISWWVVLDDDSMAEGKLAAGNDEFENKRFLGHLSLEGLYSTLMDLVNLCCSGGSH